jgi:hypothetical protein
VSTRDYEIVIRRDSTIPEGRARALKRVRAMLAHFPNGVPDRANCFLHGLTKGWAVSDVIGHADADEVEELLRERPADVLRVIPYGPEDVDDPEVDALIENEDDIPDGLWFDFWMGLKKSLYFFRQNNSEMPERSVLAWLGFLLGELEGHGISQAEYDKLRALLPPVRDDLTPLVAASQ